MTNHGRQARKPEQWTSQQRKPVLGGLGGLGGMAVGKMTVSHDFNQMTLYLCS